MAMAMAMADGDAPFNASTHQPLTFDF